MNILNVKIQEILNLMEEIYNTYNEELFNGELQPAVITIGYNRTPKENDILGRYYSNCKWVDIGDNTNYAVIELTSDVVNMGFREIINTLLHEMVHVCCKNMNISDCSKTGVHKKEFKDMAESIGLFVEKQDKLGWAATFLSDTHYELVSNVEYDTAIFDIKFEVESTPEKNKPVKNKKPKFEHKCPNGHGKPFRLPTPQEYLKCSICNNNLNIEEKGI